MKKIGEWILEALKNHDNETELAKIKGAVEEFCLSFPVPGL